VSFYLLGYLAILYIAILRFFALRQDLPLTLFLYVFIGILGGIRFETGMDWPQYAGYFESISVEQGPFTSYAENNYRLAFEFGYFLLNYTIKYLGGELTSVFMVASVFCALSTYLIASTFSGNRVFIFVIYVSYNFIYMHFSTVRQSIAVGLFLLGLWAYLKLSNKKLMTLFFALSICFQISALLYIFIFTISLFTRNTLRYITLWAIGVIGVFIAMRLGSNFYQLLSQILPSSFAAKLMEYSGWDYQLSIRTYLFGFYIAGCALSLAWLELKEKRQPNFLPYTRKERLPLSLAVTSLMLSATFILLFPNNFALWTRTFNVASILFACVLSGFYYSTVRNYKPLFLAHLLVAAVAFAVSLNGAAEAMIPYKTIFDSQPTGLSG
jgi:hypothetical protein